MGTNKLNILLLIFVLAFIAIVAKLILIQTFNPESYSADYTATNQIRPNRGKILDRNLEPLAVNQAKYLLYVLPKKVKHKDYLVSKLDEILEIGDATLSARIDESKEWVAITNNLDKSTKKKIEVLKLPEIGFQEEEARYYPEASLASHLIGFLGRDESNEALGYFGIEGYYDKDLAGLPGVIKSERDLYDKPIFNGNQERQGAEDGRDLVLTIDKSVQHIMKEEIRKGVELYKAKSGCAISVDPYNMEIQGLVCLPDFDPDEYFKSNDKVFQNWAITSEYEPGSTFKPLVMAAAIDEGVIKVGESFNEDGPIRIGEYEIQNWDNKYSGKILIPRILEKSSNVGMVYVGKKLGKENLFKYLNKYGFGDYTNIDLQGEVGGKVKQLSEWYPIDEATTAFGQGISVTGIQLIRGFAAVINGGNLMRPHVVKAVIENGKIKERAPEVQKKVLSEKTSEIMRNMLVSVVSNAEAKWDIPKGFTFGGKTGTAQIALSGKYDSSKTIASFIGFAPASKPKFLILVVIKEPGVSSWGSETAAPIFFNIASKLLVYYNIPANDN